MRSALLVLSALTVVPMAVAQPNATAQATLDPCAITARPSFDVVSVKAIDGNSRSSSIHGTSDGVIMTGSLRRTILYAYGLHDFQLTGGPDWVATSVWEIHGKNDAPDPDFAKLNQVERKALSDKRMQQVQSLLADRFQLKCHMTTKELPIYELVLAKGGAKLKPSTVEESKRNSTSTTGRNLLMHATATGIDSEHIAMQLANEVDRLVVDKTGLTGSYDLTLDWVHDAPAGREGSGGSADMPSGPTLFTALEEQLGLKLQPAKGPVPVLVVDAIERPSAN